MAEIPIWGLKHKYSAPISDIKKRSKTKKKNNKRKNMDETSKAQSTKKRINKLGFTKIKNLGSAKDEVKKMKRQVICWEKMFTKTHLIKDCYQKYTKNS